jgi:hypothetical protein
MNAYLYAWINKYALKSSSVRACSEERDAESVSNYLIELPKKFQETFYLTSSLTTVINLVVNIQATEYVA